MIPNLWEWDLQTFRAINGGLRSPLADAVYFLFSYLGLGQVQILLILGYPGYRAWREGTRDWGARLRMPEYRVATLIGLVVFSGTVLAQGCKRLMDRDRPSQLMEAIRQEEHRFNSFPSGHTTTSFALGFYFLLLTWDKPNARLGWLALFLALMVGISRIYRGVHWPTDVLGGACAGLASAALFRWVETVRASRKVAETNASAVRG